MIYADFVHLHVHSAFSLAEGAIRLPDLIEKCKRDKMPAVALTDTANLFGALEFCKTAAYAGIQPIVGCQVKIGLRSTDPRHQEFSSASALLPCDTLVLLAQNKEGYQNLMKLVSQSYLQQAHQVYIPFEWLKHHHKGLIALSGGLEGGGAQLLLKDQKEAATDFFKDLYKIFQDRFYVEITRHGLADENKIESSLLDISYDLNLPIVATNEAFFVDETMYEAHDALLCIAAGTYVNESQRRRVTSHHRLRSPREMKKVFADLPEAIENTLKIAQRCSFMVEPRAPILPAFTLDRNEAEELQIQAQAGLQHRLKMQIFQSNMTEDEKKNLEKIYQERLAHEIKIISGMGYAGYYLIVADFIKWAKNQAIPVGPGRGSGAGSLVAWVLTITDIDPIKFGLLFERFLNPERISMPDFDVDFCQDRRDEVIAYVQQRYGAERVAQIITFGKLQARAVIRDVGRVLGMPYGQIDRISKMIPNNPTNPITLKQAYAQDFQLQQMAKEDPGVHHLITLAMKLEGLYRHASTHAAGVVIGDRPLEELVALYHDRKNPIPATQFNMKDVETIGLVKFDFLGLKTLTIIQKTTDLLKFRDINIDISIIPLDDTLSFEMLQRVETVGIFQLEGAGMREVLKRMRPSRFEEIIALVALYRPGPMDDIPRYLACKNGELPVSYGHPLIENILKETYGVMVYQEQVMQIAQVMGGYTLGAADLLRRAMGKKIKSEMDAQRQIFIDGAQKNQVSQESASLIFDQMAKFAGYGFNKCHSGPYALITYQTAYLKANYPIEFMAATLTYDMNNVEKLSMYCEELARMKVKLLPPDINFSYAIFTLEKDSCSKSSIRYALSALKNVGEGAIEYLVQERQKNGPFKNIIDFVRRLDSKTLNKRMLENLICAGAFDQLHINRAQLFDSIDILMKYVGEANFHEQNQQNNLFGSSFLNDIPLIKFSEVPLWTTLDQLQKEFEAIGFYLSSHPLDIYTSLLEKKKITFAQSLLNGEYISQNTTISMAGIVISKKERLNKNGSRYAFVTFSDPSGSFEVCVFSELYLKFREKLEAGSILLMSVTVRFENSQVRLTVNSFENLDQILEQDKDVLKIYVENNITQETLQSLKKILLPLHNGKTTLKLVFDLKDTQTILKLPGYYKIGSADYNSIVLLDSVKRIE